MFKIKTRYPFLWLLLFLAGCAGAPRVEKADPGPGWIYDTNAVYPEDRYVAAVGYGSNRAASEKNALGALVSIFGQTVHGESLANYAYSEAVTSGILDSRENSEILSAVKTSFTMETLIGAEIKDGWFDGKETHYAVAVMDKRRSGMLYSDLIETNTRTIEKLLSIPPEERNSLDAYARHMLAATIVDANASFINVLSVLSPPAAMALRADLRRGDDYRLEAREIAKKIPLAIAVENDPDGRIAAAFGAILSAAGFRTTEQNASARYTLNVTIALNEVDLPQNPNKFVRYSVDAILRDRTVNQALFPYHISGRGGSTNYGEAEDRARREAEKKIRESYGEVLTNYLSIITAEPSH